MRTMDLGADSPPKHTDRLLLLGIRWGADNAVIDAIVELAREHELVLYDPLGPDVHLPSDPVESGPVPPPRLVDHLKILLVGLVAAGVFWLGWRIDVPVLDWLLMIIGGFFLIVVVFLLGIVMFGRKDETGGVVLASAGVGARS